MTATRALAQDLIINEIHKSLLIFIWVYPGPNLKSFDGVPIRYLGIPGNLSVIT